MEIIRKNIDPKTKAGSIRFKIATAEGLWHLYNIIDVGDEMTSNITRFVVFLFFML